MRARCVLASRRARIRCYSAHFFSPRPPSLSFDSYCCVLHLTALPRLCCAALCSLALAPQPLLRCCSHAGALSFDRSLHPLGCITSRCHSSFWGYPRGAPHGLRVILTRKARDSSKHSVLAIACAQRSSEQRQEGALQIDEGNDCHDE